MRPVNWYIHIFHPNKLKRKIVFKGDDLASLVNKIDQPSPATDTEEHLELIDEFVLQLSHEPIAISANGFFNINRDLLASV